MIQFWGCSRTASKAYMYMLENYSDINITKEVHVMPSFGKYQFLKEYLKFKYGHQSIKVFSSNLEKIQDASYWRAKEFDKNHFSEIISDYNKLDFARIAEALFESDRIVKGKKVSGAKFPAHVIYFPFFYRNFKKGKFILLARNPIDIYKSQINKHGINSYLMRGMMLVWVTCMFNITMFYVFVFRKNKNVHFIKYCRFKNERINTIKKLSSFLNVSFQDGMLDLPKKDSSYKKNKKIIDVLDIEENFIKLLTWLPYRYYKHKD